MSTLQTVASVARRHLAWTMWRGEARLHDEIVRRPQRFDGLEHDGDGFQPFLWAHTPLPAPDFDDFRALLQQLLTTPDPR